MLRKLVEASSDHRHVVVSLTTLGELGPQLIENGTVVHSIGMQSPLSMPLTLWRLSNFIRQECPDVIQTWMYHADLIGSIAAKRHGIPVAWGVRTTELPRSGSRMTAWIRFCCARLSDALPAKIIYAADASRKLHEHLGYATSKSIVIPNGFQLERLAAGSIARTQLRAEFGFAQHHQVIGTVGRFHDDKDQHNFLAAASKLFSKDQSLRFVMVGRGLASDNALLMHWIDEYRLREIITLLGERADVPECLSMMDIFCLPSKTEGFPNVVGEAMGVGVPCVVTDVGDARKLLGNCGVVVPKENADALAEGITSVLQLSVDARLSLANAGRRRLAEHFSVEETCQNFEQVYNDIKLKGERTCAA